MQSGICISYGLLTSRIFMQNILILKSKKLYLVNNRLIVLKMKVIYVNLALILSLYVGAQQNTQTLWKLSSDDKVSQRSHRQIIPNNYKVYELQYTQLKQLLQSAPHEKNTTINQSACIIQLPAPNGQMHSFKVVEAPVMAPELSATYPEIKTFAIQGITDEFATGKIDFTHFGFHAMVRSIKGDYFIDPYANYNTQDYITYYISDYEKPLEGRLPEVGVEGMEEPAHDKTGEAFGNLQSAMPPAPCVGNNLRTYRLAVACTGEYAVAVCNPSTATVPLTLSKIVTTINRVDGVYRTEVAVALNLVPTTTNVIFLDGATDPFNNTNATTLIGQSQTVITNTIGTANFDIGHTFSTGAGGLAGLGVVCSATNKARGVTGSPQPWGDPYDIDYVSHEIGHQFNGRHTFNALSGSCNGNRTAATSVEPGSGITIMGYAGICGAANNLGNNSIAYFHAISYDEIANFVLTGSGNGCLVQTATGNGIPSVTGPGNFVVPVNTPFMLTGSANDPNNDPLTYSWEETDPGASGGNWDSGNKPFFRSYVPANNPSRSFPIINAVLSNSLQAFKGEYLPTTAQTLNFRLTARDNRATGGGVCYAASIITVNATAGPFVVTYPNATGISWNAGSQQTITWNVNNTNTAPVNCNTVNILISYNSGASFTTLLANTPNDGTQLITVPPVSVTVGTCRIKVEAVGNVFYDINDNNFTINYVAGVGVEENSIENSFGFQIYPNPTHGNLHYEMEEVMAKDAVLSIYNLEGKEVNSIPANETGKGFISVEALTPGIYLMQIKNNQGKSVSRKLIVE